MSDKEFLEVGSEETGGFRFTFLKYLKYWYVFLIGLSLSFVGAYLYLRYSPPIYNVSSTLLIKGNEKENGLSGNAVINDLENFKSNISLDDQVDILKSKSLMQQALTDLSLFISYKVDGELKKKEIYGQELPVKLVFTKLDTAVYENEASINLKIKEGNVFELQDKGGATGFKFGQEIKRPYGVFTVVAGPGYTNYINKNVQLVFHEIKDLTDDYSDRLSVEIVNKANKEAKVVSVNLSDAVPEKGKDIINKLVELYNQAAIADKNLVATNTIQFIDERLKYLTAELSTVEKEVEQYKRRNDLTDVSSEASMYLENSSDYRKKLSDIDNELEVLKSLEGTLGNNRGSSFDMIPTTISIQDPTLLSSIAKYNELQLERERMLRIEQPNSPLVQNVNEQLINIRQNILSSIRNIKNGLTITRRNLQVSAEKFASQIQKVPQMERELQEVKRQQGTKQELYLYLLQKREEAALSLAATTVSSARIIDPAMADKLPISPKKRSVYMLAILLGLGLPFAFLYAKSALYDQIQHQSDVTKATKTPILGEISHKKTNEVLVVSAESRTPIAELFRLIRTNLHYRTKGLENKVILVTSSISGEGKTFFAINFAASLAMTGKKVIALDFDLRKPSLLEDLGLDNKVGITDYLTSDDVLVNQIITTSPMAPNLYVAGTGPIPHNPAELIMSDKLEQLIAELKEQFDFIVIDTAPVGQVADAFSLNYYSDLMIYLIRYNYTSKSYLKIINDIYENKKFSQPMIVLNDSDTSNSYQYGYGGYGYPGNQKQKNKKGSLVAALKSLI